MAQSAYNSLELFDWSALPGEQLFSLSDIAPCLLLWESDRATSAVEQETNLLLFYPPLAFTLLQLFLRDGRLAILMLGDFWGGERELMLWIPDLLIVGMCCPSNDWVAARQKSST